MKHILCCLLAFMWCISPVFAVKVTGRVTDERGESLPFATVIVKGATNGTTANADGVYALELPAGTYVLTCQYIGYRSDTREVHAEQGTVTINWQLQPRHMELQEVVIRSGGEDPAYRIMREVIKKRKYHADLLQTFETDIYLKGVLRLRSLPEKLFGISLTGEDTRGALRGAGLDTGGKGILYLVEQTSRYVFQNPGKTYNKVISVRESGDPQGLGFATMPPVTNPYQNNIRVLEGLNERGFISPANSNAFLYYRYKLEGSYTEGDRTIHKIRVIPKRRYEPLFSGHVYVVEDEWVFQSLRLTLTQESQMQALDTLVLEQYYMPVSKDIWIIQSQVLYPVIRFMGIEAAGHFLTSYKNQQVNRPVDESLFSGRTIAAYDSLATTHTAAYWDTIRPVPLEQDEVRDYEVKDSLRVAEQSRQDSLPHKPELGAGAFLFSGPSLKTGRHTWGMRPLISSVSYNTVEGVHATLGLRWRYRTDADRSFGAELRNRYGFGNRHYHMLLKAGYLVQDPGWKERSWRFGIQGGQYVYQLNNDNPITPFMNLLYTLIGGENYMKLYQSRLGRLETQRNWGNGLKAILDVAYEERIPLTNTTAYTFLENPDPRLTANQPPDLPAFRQHRAAIIHASVSYQPGWRYIRYPGFKKPVAGDAPVFSADYTKGIPGIAGSNTDFDKWQASVAHSLPMRMLGTLQYRLAAGGFLNNRYTGIPDMQHIAGNRTVLAGPYLHSFQLAPYYRFSNTAPLYVQGHAEWHLGGLLTNKLPGFRRLNWYLVGGGNALYIDEHNYYIELFAGLENIGFNLFRFGRVDFIAGYESGKGRPLTGVRISLGEVFWSLLGMGSSKDDLP